MTASQKTGPRLWLGIPRGGVKPAVWFQGGFIFHFLAQATCTVADVSRGRIPPRLVFLVSLPETASVFSPWNGRGLHPSRGADAASKTKYRADGTGRNVPAAETMQQVPVQQR